jgi:hypothetical protein
MKISRNVILAFSAVPLVFSLTARTQNSTVVTVGGGAVAVLGPGLPQGQVNVPYSADQESETTRTLADGTHIVSKTRSRMYRDSQGRMRREMFAPDYLQAREGSQEPNTINITDPVEGVQYSLNPRNHTAMRNPFGVRRTDPPQPPPKPPVNVRPPSPPPRELMPHSQSEDLGTQMIEGVWAKGTRTTTTIPANSVGNDRPIVSVVENWLSEELGLNVSMKRSDPRYGDVTERVTNIDRSEPDPALFRPPADYTITEPTRIQ